MAARIRSQPMRTILPITIIMLAAAFSGRIPIGRFHPLIDDVLNEARAVLPHIGIWEGPRRTSLQQGSGRLNILTPQGLCFGEAPLQTLDQDPTSRALLYAATKLMQKLTGMALAGRQSRKLPG